MKQVFGRRPIETEPAPLSMQEALASLPTAAPDQAALAAAAEAGPPSADVERARTTLRNRVLERIDPAGASRMSEENLRTEIQRLVHDIGGEERFQLNAREQRRIVEEILHDMLGLGPLEPLLADDSVTDIMVNGPFSVWVERRGKLVLTEVRFRDNDHVAHIAQRIASAVGRRVDESSPIADARLKDGSRVNILLPPLVLNGPTLSIRKFSRKSITLEIMARQGNMSAEMARFLEIAARARLNIVISGGTGSGKTTLLNACSRNIDIGERVITIEDAAELQLQQPHVLSLETRPANLEGGGEINQRDLVKNALRMRPDRIILGEIRGGEAFDMLQAMNTGHDGSMCTIHSNNPRDGLARLENMVLMAGVGLPLPAIRTQIVAAVDLVVQIERMRDGIRRLQSITEVQGLEHDVIVTQELFRFEYEGEGADGLLRGDYVCSQFRPRFLPKVRAHGLEERMLETLGLDPKRLS